MKNFQGFALAGCSALALAGCGPSDIASPGSGGNVTINYPTSGTSGGGSSSGGGTVTAASGCPTITNPVGLTDAGTITGPTGTWRVCQLPRTFTASATLRKFPGVLYSMNGRVDVGCDGGFAVPTDAAQHTSTTIGCTTALKADTNVTLTIEPGVILFGNTGQSWLAVNRGNKISAVGSATQPIIFTSRDNVLGQVDDTSQSQWGGVVLLGRAPITDCSSGLVTSNTCQRDTEGAAEPALYGGTNAADNSGRMSFVQIRYSGFALAPDKELQALTTGGVGSATIFNNIQSHNSSDDGAEFFGGVVNMRYFVATGADDDSLDVDMGAQMNLQYALLLPRSGKGDALFEIDSDGKESDTPRTKLHVSNFLAIQPQTSPDNEGSKGALAAAYFRGNSDTTLTNGILLAPNNECIRMKSTSSSGSAPASLTTHSVVLQCNTTKFLGVTYTAAQVAGFFGSGSNNNNDAFTPTLATLFVNGSNETAVPAFDASTLSSYFTKTTYIGAVQNGADTWYAGWTCNSGTANFGSTSTACTSLPTT